MLKQTSTTEQSPAQLKQQLAHSQERSQFFLIAIQALLYFLKEFSFDLSEIGAEEFKRRLDVLFDLLSSNEHTSFLTDAFDDHKEFILNFIGEERKYIGDRENELMDIITLLRNGLYGVLGECNDYNAKMYQHSRKIEDILSLDDIKHIKQSLQHEVEQMRSNIREKEAAETKRLESLAKEVDSLKTNLEHIKDVSLTDSLTGAYNRLAFDTHIRRHIERNTISWYPFSVLMCDIDNFKSINDTYGHQVGDRVLMCFVHECKEFFRNDDFIARYGGEEFAMILPGTSLRDAMKRAKTFCKDLASKMSH
ncbi:MAG TPA: diguanylate cyclase [Armatimonadota bacterium]|nr:diguanylate cyclase [Armatimonadota bacterium]